MSPSGGNQRAAEKATGDVKHVNRAADRILGWTRNDKKRGVATLQDANCKWLASARLLLIRLRRPGSTSDATAFVSVATTCDSTTHPIIKPHVPT